MDTSFPFEQFSNESWKKKQECTANNEVVSNSLMGLPLYSPPFVRGTPFAPQLFFLRTPSRTLNNNHHSVTTSPPHIVLRNSLVSTLNGCLRKLNDLASQNPLLKNVLSFPSHFHSFCQIPCRNNRNLSVLSNHNFAAILPGDSLAGVVVANGILNFLNIYNTLLVVRLVLTWFPNTPPAIVSPLSTLCDPYLNIFRGIIPPLGGTLDLSPILAFLVLNVFSSTAAALPAELPSPGVSRGSPSVTTLSHLTTLNEKWMRRLAGNRSNNSSNGN